MKLKSRWCRLHQEIVRRICDPSEHVLRTSDELRQMSLYRYVQIPNTDFTRHKPDILLACVSLTVKQEYNHECHENKYINIPVVPHYFSWRKMVGKEPHRAAWMNGSTHQRSGQ